MTTTIHYALLGGGRLARHLRHYLKLEGLVIEDPDNTSPGIKLRVESLVRAMPEDTGGGEFEMALVKKDDKYIVFGPRGAEKTEVSLQVLG